MRGLFEIAMEIQSDWKNINYGAKPYLEAMGTMESIGDYYGEDTGKSIVNYFLANAGSWRGETAKSIKLELKSMMKS